jgi:inorganic pyrophosphatase
MNRKGIQARWHASSGGKEEGILRVIIGTPKGSRNKYKFDQKTGPFKLSKMLPEGLVFPNDFALCPRPEQATAIPRRPGAD